MNLVLNQCQTLNLEQELHWAKKLTGERALAPHDMQRDGLTQSEYLEYSKQFDKFCSEYVKEQLYLLVNDMDPQTLQYGVVSVLGPGLARGLRFIPLANRLGLRVELHDLCDEALRFTDRALKTMKAWSSNTTVKTEVKGEDGEISSDTNLIVMSQFLQILPEPQMQAIMQMIARHMVKVSCRVIVVHPFENTDVEWGDTTPYTQPQILEPMEQETGKTFYVSHEQFIRYFNRHNYKAFTIRLIENV